MYDHLADVGAGLEDPERGLHAQDVKQSQRQALRCARLETGREELQRPPHELWIESHVVIDSDHVVRHVRRRCGLPPRAPYPALAHLLEAGRLRRRRKRRGGEVI
jgi:hypothetical protein